jgi:phosphoglycerate dehydrogenase-like enzyme
VSDASFNVVRLTARIFAIRDYERRRLAEHGFPVVECHDEDPEAIARAVADADVVVTIGTPMPRRVVDALGVTMTDLETVLRESDYVSLHVPLTKRTENMIDAAALAKMKPEAVLINTSRGRLVDEAALHRALVEGRIAGAGIDTWGAIDIFVDRIAPPLTPLAALDNVILSPHTAGQSVQASFDMMDAGVANLVALRAGQMPAQETIVNPAVRARFRFKGQAR